MLAGADAGGAGHAAPDHRRAAAGADDACHWITQTFAVIALNLRTIPQRLSSSAVAIVGIAGVVVVFVSVLSIAAGFTAAMRELGLADARARDAQRRRQRDDERPRRHRGRHHQAGAGHPARRPDAAGLGRAATSSSTCRRRRTGTPANVPMRGIEPRRFAVRDEVSIVEGRMFEFGTNEVIVGRGASGQFVGLNVGSEVRSGQNRGRSSASSRPTAAWRRPRSGATRACCRAPIAAATPISRARAARAAGHLRHVPRLADANPQLNVQVRRENEYYAEQSQALTASSGRSASASRR